MTNRYDLVGPHALVTGAGAGIGLATAELLAGNGARVAVHSLTRAEAEAAARRVGRKAFPLWGDLADAPTRDALAGATLAAFGARLHILVHNAGIYPQGTLEDETLETYRRVLAINAESNWHLTKRLLPALTGDAAGPRRTKARAAAPASARAHDPGASVVLVSSVVTRLGLGDSPAYVASKAAQIGLARHLAAELGPRGVRVNCVLPGQVETPGSHAALGKRAEKVYRDTAERAQMIRVRLGAGDIAAAVAFLCSTAARGITAAGLDVNAGMRVGG